MYKGGMSTYAKAECTIKKCLAYTKHTGTVVTTMFDFYRLPKDTPGMTEIRGISNPYDMVAVIEESMKKEESLQRPVYLPYIQLHEFEALLFSNLDIVGEKYFDHDIGPLRQCLAEKKNPELINNGEETAPSKRIRNCIADYDKTTTGVDILVETGLTIIRSKCKHFDEWISKLENI
jgi:hypothetical protein